jgi:hypothetical protein
MHRAFELLLQVVWWHLVEILTWNYHPELNSNTRAKENGLGPRRQKTIQEDISSPSPHHFYWDIFVPPTSFQPHLKQLQKVSVFYFVYISISTILLHFHFLIHPPPSYKYPAHTYCIYLTVLSFITNPKVNVQRGFSTYPHCKCTLLWSVQHLPLLSLTPSFPPLVIQ